MSFTVLAFTTNERCRCFKVMSITYDYISRSLHARELSLPRDSPRAVITPLAPRSGKNRSIFVNVDDAVVLARNRLNGSCPNIAFNDCRVDVTHR